MGCFNRSKAESQGVSAQAAFLLPWRRIFNLSDSQLYVAKRENAKALFRGHIDSKGGILQVLLGPVLKPTGATLTRAETSEYCCMNDWQRQNMFSDAGRPVLPVVNSKSRSRWYIVCAIQR